VRNSGEREGEAKLEAKIRVRGVRVGRCSSERIPVMTRRDAAVVEGSTVQRVNED
jgi:hypothetical protein